ncbi:MAG TPA: hypothetical protein VKG38_01295 [Solirubrobacteraceae bacterium]|nr:hypothetical protein [Solirubrobacteraceae bacterium]
MGVVVGRLRTAMCGALLTLAMLGVPTLATASPAAADGWGGCPSLCGAVSPPAYGSWQPDAWNGWGGAAGYWFDFLKRHAHGFCPRPEGPVAESAPLDGAGYGATVNEGGEGGQPSTCEGVAE